MAGGSVGQAVITVGADGGPFAKELKDQTTKAGREAGESGGNAFTDAIGTVFKRSAQLVGAAVATTVMVGFKTAMDDEVAKMKFTQLFKGQVDKAQGFIEDLKVFAAKTPFDFPGLQDAAGRFLAVGIAAERVIPLMTNLGNITSIMGSGAEGVRHATMALQQMAVAGKVTGGDMLQLLNANIPAWDLLADSMGKPVPELRKMMEKGLIPAEAMFKALENSSGKTMQTFNGGMEKMALTTEGKLSTLKDNFSQFAARMVSDLIPAANSFVTFLSDTAIPGVEKFVGDLKTWLGQIDWQPFINAIVLVKDYVVGFVTDATVKAWAEGAIEGVKVLAGWIKDTLVPALVDLAGKVRDVVNWFRDHETAAKALQVTLGVVFALITAAWVKVGIEAAISAAKQAAAWLLVAVSGESAGAAATLSIAQQVVQWAFLGVQALLHAAKVAAAWLIAMGPIGLVIAAVVGLVALVIANLDTIKAWISGAWDWITEHTYKAWQSIYSFFENIWNNITGWISNALDNIKGWIGTAWKWIQDTTAAVWDKVKWFIFGPLGAIVLFVINNLDTIKSTISNAWENIKSWTSNAWNTVLNFIRTAWQNIVNAVSEKINAVIEFARGLPGRVVSAVGDLARTLWDKGTSIIQGLLDGAMEKIRGIGDWASQIKDKIIDAIKSVFGIHSPSTVFAGLGVNMMQGLLQGLLQGPEILRSAIKAISSNLTDWLGNIGGRVGEFFSNLFGGGTIEGGKVSVGGKLLDTDTYAKITQALGGAWRLFQGSWSTSVAASAGTHAGSGVADIAPTGMSWQAAEAALRLKGLIAWFRNWAGNLHIHLVNPAVSGLSRQAAAQVASFMRGGNGLAYAGGTPSAMPGWALVGERGPEWIRFRGGEQVLPSGRSPATSITVNMTISVDDLDKMSKIGDFIDMLDRARLDQRRTYRSGMVSA